VLERVWCEWDAPADVTLSPAPSAANGSVSRGAFSYVRADGVVAISGRIVDAATAVGTLNVASCPAKTWLVHRVEPPK
jgi:hypothetical protein